VYACQVRGKYLKDEIQQNLYLLGIVDVEVPDHEELGTVYVKVSAEYYRI
jgi:hypothetical protein